MQRTEKRTNSLYTSLLFLVLMGFIAAQSSSEPVNKNEIVLDSTVLEVHSVITRLSVPWDIEYGPDGWIWFTEQHGAVSRVNPENGQKQTLLEVKEVYFKRSTGMLGMAVGLDKATQNTYAYVHYTYKKGEKIASKVVRYTFVKDTLINPFILIDSDEATDAHNGSRIAIAPDGKIIVAMGDVNIITNAQNKSSLFGKILRFNPDGSVPDDNPTPGSLVWSYGHRNPQGLCVTAAGKIYESEHGVANDDEVNLIEKGQNYGYPNVTGLNDTPQENAFYVANNIKPPLKCWTPTIAPAGMAFYPYRTIPEWHNSLIMCTLKECDLRVLRLNLAGTAVTAEKTWADRYLGRLRDVCIAPNGDVFVSTSNRDWNPTCEGFPKPEDDQIIRLRKVRTLRKSEQLALRKERKALMTTQAPGALVYEQHCQSCHKIKGEGLAETFPPLAGSEWLKKDKELVGTILQGLSGKIMVKNKPYEGVMPAFDFLSDQQIADVLTYVRQSFGNQEATITFKNVEKIRLELPKK